MAGTAQQVGTPTWQLDPHRGQLSVYLRLLDVPVPSMYGPKADEPWGAQASPEQ